MGTTYELTIRDETEENPHIIIYDPNTDPNASGPPSPWKTFDPSGPRVPFTFETDYGFIQVAGALDATALRRSAASKIDLEGVQSADLVMRGRETEGYSFTLENVRRG